MFSQIKFQPIRQLGEIFEIEADTTTWSGEYLRIQNGKQVYFTPNRATAPFKINEALRIKCSSFIDGFGIYALAFEVPEPAVYVGIASKSRVPEGILRRLRKHRIKVTGSHVGADLTSCGGVSHTKGWRTFAVQRHMSFGERLDTCEDALFTVALLDTNKSNLELIETTLISDPSYLANMFWGNKNKSINLLTSAWRRKF